MVVWIPARAVQVVGQLHPVHELVGVHDMDEYRSGVRNPLAPTGCLYLLQRYAKVAFEQHPYFRQNNFHAVNIVNYFIIQSRSALFFLVQLFKDGISV